MNTKISKEDIKYLNFRCSNKNCPFYKPNTTKRVSKCGCGSKIEAECKICNFEYSQNFLKHIRTIKHLNNKKLSSSTTITSTTTSFPLQQLPPLKPQPSQQLHPLHPLSLQQLPPQNLYSLQHLYLPQQLAPHQQYSPQQPYSLNRNLFFGSSNANLHKISSHPLLTPSLEPQKLIPMSQISKPLNKNLHNQMKDERCSGLY